eukprot:ANDGO_03053.mRNA.1 GTPase-activating protein MSB4
MSIDPSTVDTHAPISYAHDPNLGFTASEDDHDAVASHQKWLDSYYKTLPSLRKRWRWALKGTNHYVDYAKLSPRTEVCFSSADEKIILERIASGKRSYKQLKTLCKAGVPHDLRGLWWYYSSGAYQRHAESPHYYQYCISLFEKHPQAKASIVRDVDRTFPDHPFFKTIREHVPSCTVNSAPKHAAGDENRNGNGNGDCVTLHENGTCPDHLGNGGTESAQSTQQTFGTEHDISDGNDGDAIIERIPRGQLLLQNVLGAYSNHNAAVGYCQSLNFLAGVLLLAMEEERAFWTLVSLLEERFPDHAFGKDLFGLRVQQNALHQMLADFEPHIYRFLSRAHMDTAMFTTGWFLCAYLNVLPVSSVLRIWDLFVFQGSKIIFRVALALFRRAEPEIMRIKRQKKQEDKEARKTAKGAQRDMDDDLDAIPSSFYVGEVLMIMRNLCAATYDVETVLAHALTDYRSLSKKAVAQYMKTSGMIVAADDERKLALRRSQSNSSSGSGATP